MILIIIDTSYPTAHPTVNSGEFCDDEHKIKFLKISYLKISYNA